MTTKELISQAEELLRKGGVIDPKGEAERLFMAAAGISYTCFLMIRDEEAEERFCRDFEAMAERRAKREPLQFIVGKAPFFGRDFLVSPDVLIPRFDTEILVQEVLKELGGRETVLDLCTGSGCIAVTLKKEAPKLFVLASDISKEALSIAKMNAALFGADVSFFESDLFSGIPEEFDVLVSNPPYITSSAIEELEPEVRDHEPRLSLDGGEDGLTFYRQIAKEAKEHFSMHRQDQCCEKHLRYGRIFLEIGDDQEETVQKILHEAGYRDIATVYDLAGRPRVVKAVYEA